MNEHFLWLSVGEAARRLALSPETVRRMCDNDTLASWRTPGGHRRISADSVNQLAP